MIGIRMKRTPILLGAAVPWVLVAACDLVSAPPKGPEATSLVEQVYVIDAEGTTCLSCPDGEIPVEVREIIEAADSEMVGRWIQERFFSRDTRFDKYFKVGDPVKRGLDFGMGRFDGVFYQGDVYQIHYESISCWVWDCYKPRMWRIDEGGKQRWRRRVPFAHAPVYPFVVGDYVLYVGGSVDGYILVIIDLDTGEVVGHYLPDGEKEGFHDSALLFAPPFYRDGFIFLKGHTVVRWQPGKFETRSETPAKIYVLKVRF